jgi:hypothetical protein
MGSRPKRGVSIRARRGSPIWARRLIAGTVASFVIAGATSLPVSAGVTPKPPVVTAVSDTSSLGMQSGYPHYLYVAATSAGATITASSFQYDDFSCGTTLNRFEPDGRSMPISDEATFTTNGDVAALAGVAVAGYSVSLIDRGAVAALCGTVPSGIPMRYQAGWSTGSLGGTYVILVGTEGGGTFTDAQIRSGGYPCHARPIKTLQNATATNGTDAGSVGIFSADVRAHSTCVFDVTSAVADGATDASFAAIWANVYLLTPTTR